MRILVIEARFYDGISDALLEGALKVLQANNVEVTKVTVPGALEVPHVASLKRRGLAMMDMSRSAALFAVRQPIMIMSVKNQPARLWTSPLISS